MLQGDLPLQLGDELGVRRAGPHGFPQRQHVLRRLHEGEGDEVDPLLQAEAQVLEVPGGGGVGGQGQVREVHPLVREDEPAGDHPAGQAAFLDTFRRELDVPVVQQDARSRGDVPQQVGVPHRHPGERPAGRGGGSARRGGGSARGGAGAPAAPAATGSSRTRPPLSSGTPEPGSAPVRIFGPLRSWRMPMLRPVSSRTRRRSRMTRRCSSSVPCEKFRRATSMPASTISLRVAGAEQAGPMVQTILVFLNIPAGSGILQLNIPPSVDNIQARRTFRQ